MTRLNLNDFRCDDMCTRKFKLYTSYALMRCCVGLDACDS